MSGLQVDLELFVCLPYCLQRDAVVSELTGDKELDKIVKTDRPVTADGLIVTLENGRSPVSNWDARGTIPAPFGASSG